MNGFISAVFGLYEYIHLFPDDKEGAKVFADCITSIKNSVRIYDNGSWTYLDRHNSSYPGANDDYMMGYYWQMRTLSEITRDPFFGFVELRWWSFFNDVNVYTKGNSEQDRQGFFHTPETQKVLVVPASLIKFEDIRDYRSTDPIPGYDVSTLFDNNVSTYFAPVEKLPTYIHLNLKRSVLANTLALTLYNVDLYPEKLSIFVKSEDNKKWRELSFTRSVNRRFFAYKFLQESIKELKIVCDTCRGQKRLVISELALHNNADGRMVLPEYGSFVSEVKEIDYSQFEVRLDVVEISNGDIVVLHKYDSSPEKLAEKGWDFDFINPLESNSTETKGKYYQFKVIYRNKNPGARWNNLRILPIQARSKNSETQRNPEGSSSRVRTYIGLRKDARGNFAASRVLRLPKGYDWQSVSEIVEQCAG